MSDTTETTKDAAAESPVAHQSADAIAQHQCWLAEQDALATQTPDPAIADDTGEFTTDEEA